MYNGVELYEQNGKVAVLFAKGYGSGWSSTHDSRLAYDKRVIDFWLEHKGDNDFMCAISDWHGNEINSMAKKLFMSWGYEDFTFYAFRDLSLKWVNKNSNFIIREYDGYEYVEVEKDVKWICFQ